MVKTGQELHWLSPEEKLLVRVYLVREEPGREKPNPLLPLRRLSRHRVTGKKGGESFFAVFLPV
jgi:hypothetical protein